MQSLPVFEIRHHRIVARPMLHRQGDNKIYPGQIEA